MWWFSVQKAKEPVHVPPQPFRALEHLLGNAGRLVTRDELGDVIWEEEVFVDRNLGLNQCIQCLRRVLGDAASRPRYIQTVPRRGHRFIAAVEVEPARREGPGDEVAAAGGVAPQGLRIAVLPFSCFSPPLVAIRFGDVLSDEILRELFSCSDRERQVVAPQRLADSSLRGASPAVPDLVVTGSARYESGLLRILGYLIRGRDGLVLRTWVWQSEAERIGLDTHLEAAAALVENLLGALPASAAAR